MLSNTKNVENEMLQNITYHLILLFQLSLIAMSCNVPYCLRKYCTAPNGLFIFKRKDPINKIHKLLTVSSSLG